MSAPKKSVRNGYDSALRSSCCSTGLALQMFGPGRCALQTRLKFLQKPLHNGARFATRAKPAARSRKRHTGLIALSGVTVVGAGLVAFTDSGRTSYGAVERTGRVVYTLGRCVYEYETHIILHMLSQVLSFPLSPAIEELSIRNKIGPQRSTPRCSNHATSDAPSGRCSLWSRTAPYSSSSAST